MIVILDNRSTSDSMVTEGFSQGSRTAKRLRVSRGYPRALCLLTPGMSSVFSAYAPMVWPVVMRYLWIAEPKALAREREAPIGYRKDRM